MFDVHYNVSKDNITTKSSEVKNMEEQKTYFEKEKEDSVDFAKIIKKIPENRKRDARLILEGFALCAESEKKMVV